MPELRCQECGKKLLPGESDRSGGTCLCSACGRPVYPGKKTTIAAKCPSCGKDNQTKVNI